jgi:RHS repeat-associated protein
MVRWRCDHAALRPRRRESGSYAEVNPFRWSTKYFDIETGLSDYGHRYYHAGLGRWLNRDPIGEFGGANLYGYVHNSPATSIDPLGQFDVIDCMNTRCGEPPDRPARNCAIYSYDWDNWCLCVKDCRHKNCTAITTGCIVDVVPSAAGVVGCAVGCLLAGGPLSPAYWICMAGCGITDVIGPALIWRACAAQARECRTAADQAYKNCAR